MKKSGKWGYIDKTGKTVISPKYANAGSFSEGLAAVSAAGKYGYIDKAGKETVAPAYEQALDFSVTRSYSSGTITLPVLSTKPHLPSFFTAPRPPEKSNACS